MRCRSKEVRLSGTSRLKQVHSPTHSWFRQSVDTNALHNIRVTVGLPPAVAQMLAVSISPQCHLGLPLAVHGKVETECWTRYCPRWYPRDTHHLCNPYHRGQTRWPRASDDWGLHMTCVLLLSRRCAIGTPMPLQWVPRRSSIFLNSGLPLD